MHRTGMIAALGCCLLACATSRIEPVVRPLSFDPGGSCTPAGGHPSHEALRESAALAQSVLGDTLATLGNEFPETRRQFIDRDWAPLQRFPRLTFPALVDPRHIGGARTRNSSWFVPLVLDKKQLGEVDAEALTGELSFWLVPHGADVGDARWQDVTECLVRDPTLEGTVFVSDSERRPDFRAPGDILPTIARRERLRGVVLEVPTQTIAPNARVESGFYDLKILPRLNSLGDLTIATPALEKVVNALHEGDWPAALLATREMRPRDLAGARAAEELREMAARIAPANRWMATAHPSPFFEAVLRILRGELRDLAKELDSDNHRPGAIGLALSRLEQPMRSLLASAHSIAPVALKDPDRERGRCGGRNCIRVAVAGDFQYHGNLGALRRFLGMLDPEMVRAAGSDTNGSLGPATSGSSVPDVDFVLFAGDLADAAAGSAKDQLALNVLGVLPPTSPYGEGGGREMLDIRGQLALFQKPFFAVPGNHDGYAGFGGILNVVFDEFGFATGEAAGLLNRRFGRWLGGKIKSINDVVPTFVGWRLLNRHPRWDGLGEYQHYLGPLNGAFKFRGHSFVGLNSYDLKSHERASVGGVVLHWGGGLQDRSVDWMEDMLNRFAPDPGREQFVFMHHDPRGAVPMKSSYAEQQFGLYDAINTPISQVTFGHFGLGNSPRTGLYIPIVSFAATFIWRGMDLGWGDDAGSFQQEWMRKPDWGLPLLGESRFPRFFDHGAYNARNLIEVINCNLAGRSESSAAGSPSSESGRCADPKGHISQVLIAHDNVPVDTLWADPAQRGRVFREPTRGQLWRPEGFEISGYGQFGALFGLKARNGSPPGWAQRMLLDESDGNAHVLRMDDVGDAGNYHGFHVITLYDNGDREMQWFALPR